MNDYYSKQERSAIPTVSINTQPIDGGYVMGLLDLIFGSRTAPNNRVRNQILPSGNSFSNDKEVITVDPHKPLPDSSRRPPIIFENGLT